MCGILLRVAAIVGLMAAPATLRDGIAAEVERKDTPGRTPDCVYVGTPYDVIDTMVELASIERGQMVYDLGCGDARILVAAALQCGCRGVGYDINPVRVEESIENARGHQVSHLVSIELKDIFTLDLSEADVVMLYLLPKMNAKLIRQLRKLKPGSRIVCHDYGIEKMAPENTVTMTSLEDGAKHTIYLYEAPLKKEA